MSKEVNVSDLNDENLKLLVALRILLSWCIRNDDDYRANVISFMKTACLQARIMNNDVSYNRRSVRSPMHQKPRC